MLAARDRAAGGAARAALLRGPEPPPAQATPDSTARATAVRPAEAAGPAATPSAPPINATEPKKITAAPGEPKAAVPSVEDLDTLGRLREAKRRRERH